MASEVASHYDRIVKRNAEANGETYYGDMEEYKISYKDKDTSSFRLFWKYAPMFRVMELQDMYRTMSVYLMLFTYERNNDAQTYRYHVFIPPVA